MENCEETRNGKNEHNTKGWVSPSHGFGDVGLHARHPNCVPACILGTLGHEPPLGIDVLSDCSCERMIYAA